MAEVTNTSSHTHDGKKNRRRMGMIRVDMTPMVDLACLLLTFFMLATAFSKPTTMEVSFPKEGKETTPWPKQSMTVLVDASKEKIYYYFGKFDQNVHLNVVSLQNEGFRKLLFDKNSLVTEKVNAFKADYRQGRINKEQLEQLVHDAVVDKKALPVIVKTGKAARYETVVNVIDELNLCNISRYAISDMDDAEAKRLEQFLLTAQR